MVELYRNVAIALILTGVRQSQPCMIERRSRLSYNGVVVRREPMNQHSTPTTASRLRVTLQLEAQASGKIAASVVEFPDCRVEAATREAAIAGIQAAFLERIARIETISWDVPLPSDQLQEKLNVFDLRSGNPWIKFAGMFQDDPDFAEIAAAIRAERNIEDDTEVDPSVYSLEG